MTHARATAGMTRARATAGLHVRRGRLARAAHLAPILACPRAPLAAGARFGPQTRRRDARGILPARRRPDARDRSLAPRTRLPAIPRPQKSGVVSAQRPGGDDLSPVRRSRARRRADRPGPATAGRAPLGPRASRRPRTQPPAGRARPGTTQETATDRPRRHRVSAAPHDSCTPSPTRRRTGRPHQARENPNPQSAARHGRDSESRTARGGPRQARRNAAFSDSGARACSTASMLAPMTAAFSAATDCTIERYSVASGVERV